MVESLKIVLNVSRFKSALNLNRGFGGFKPRLKFFKFHLRRDIFIERYFENLQRQKNPQKLNDKPLGYAVFIKKT